MPDFPTFQELFRVARDEALSRNSKLTREIIERSGSDANALVAAGVAVGDTIVGQLIRLSAALTLDVAKKADLDRLVYDRYQITRNPAAPALVNAVVTTASPASPGFTIPVDTPFKASDGKAFAATAQVVFPTGSSGPVTVPLQSVLTGLSQQVSIGQITSMTLAAAPADVSVTNTEASSGAADEEKDEALRDRAKRFYTTSQRGTLTAIERGALGVPGVRVAKAFEVVEPDSTPARLVDLMIADEFTEQLVDASVTPTSYQTQSDLLALTVKSTLQEVRAAGINVLVTVAQVRILGITLLLRYRTGVDVAATTEAARARTVAYTNALAPGETFVVDDLEDLLQTVPGLNVLGGEVVSPTRDQTAENLQVWRTSSDEVVIGNA
jgi:uncharacterized phage protein gp47/JayE